MKTIWKLTIWILGSLILVCAASAQQNAGGGTPATSSVSNGQWVNANEYIWTQITTAINPTVSATASFRFLLPNGTTSTATQTIASCAITNAASGFGYQIPASGWLQSAVATINTGGYPQGTFYINQYVMTALPSGGTTNSCTNSLASFTGINPTLLSSGVVGSFYPVSFVGTSSIPMSPWSIPGYTNVITVSNPSAGADWTTTIPVGNSSGGGQRTCVQAVFATLTNNATVANRVPILQFIFDAANAQIDYIAGTAGTASQTVNYSWSPGVTQQSLNFSGTTFFQTIPINNGQPVCFNSGIAGSIVRTSTAGIQTGDQWSNVRLIVQTQNDNN